MPVYTYKGTNRSGNNVSGEATATSKADLQSQLKRQNITPTKMSEKGKEFNMPTFGGGVNSNSLFCTGRFTTGVSKSNRLRLP